MKNVSVTHQRFFLGILLLTLGLLTIGVFPSKGRPVIGNSMKSPGIPVQLRPSPQKYLGKYRFYPNEPVAISNIKVQGNPISLNSKVIVTDDWLKGFSFTLKNISSKNITYASIRLLFPETK